MVYRQWVGRAGIVSEVCAGMSVVGRVVLRGMRSAFGVHAPPSSAGAATGFWAPKSPLTKSAMLSGCLNG